ncbi:MAG: cytosolic protein [bacterium]
MHTLLIFSTSTPILILSTFEKVDSDGMTEKLSNMGIDKFVAFEVPIDKAREIYGHRFQQIEDAIDNDEDIRVLDYNGFTAFKNFDIDELQLSHKFQSDTETSSGGE